MADFKKWAMFALATLVVVIVATALLEAARRRGLITKGPSDALADLITPPAGAQIPATPVGGGA